MTGYVGPESKLLGIAWNQRSSISSGGNALQPNYTTTKYFVMTIEHFIQTNRALTAHSMQIGSQL